jgi:hypothetical protein
MGTILCYQGRAVAGLQRVIGGKPMVQRRQCAGAPISRFAVLGVFIVGFSGCSGTTEGGDHNGDGGVTNETTKGSGGATTKGSGGATTKGSGGATSNFGGGTSVGGTFTGSSTTTSVGGASGGTTGTTVDGICGSGCDVEGSTSLCAAPKVSLICRYAPSNQRTILVANGCTDIPTGAVRYCCPSAIQTQCQ